MRLQKKARQPKLRAMNVIGREVEPSAEFDFGQLVSEQVENLREEMKEEERMFKEEIAESIIYALSHLRLLEETLKLDILGADRERLLELAWPLAQTAQGRYNDPSYGSIVSESSPPTLQVGALQLFPEARSLMRIDDANLDAAKQALIARKPDKNITAFVMILCVLRPDKKNELATLVDVEYFKETWNERQGVFKSRKLGFFLGTYAAFLLVHPEERSRFSLTESEKRELIQGIRAEQYPRSQMTSILKNAAIVLGESAEIDEQGKIQVVWPKPKRPPEPSLPLRPLA